MDYYTSMSWTLETNSCPHCLKSWKYTVLVEAHDKLGHQGTHAHTA